MTTLAEFMIIASADNRPPMLEKSLYDSWKSQDGTTRTKKYEELSVAEKLQADCDLKAMNIILQGLPPDVYDIVNHHKVSKEIWDIDETMYQYYWRFAQLIHNMNIINMSMRPVQVNTKFLNTRMEQAIIQHDMVTVQQVQGRQGQSYAGTGYKGNATSSRGNNEGGQARVVKCYNCQGKGHMARQCTQSNRPSNTAWFKEKAMLAEAQESSQILDEEQLAFLVDPGIPGGQAAQTTITNTAAF
ncbi:ribonuclease H-like domain-containing protein [Tanacetum coccineum]